MKKYIIIIFSVFVLAIFVFNDTAWVQCPKEHPKVERDRDDKRVDKADDAKERLKDVRDVKAAKEKLDSGVEDASPPASPPEQTAKAEPKPAVREKDSIEKKPNDLRDFLIKKSHEKIEHVTPHGVKTNNINVFYAKTKSIEYPLRGKTKGSAETAVFNANGGKNLLGDNKFGFYVGGSISLIGGEVMGGLEDAKIGAGAILAAVRGHGTVGLNVLGWRFQYTFGGSILSLGAGGQFGFSGFNIEAALGVGAKLGLEAVRIPTKKVVHKK